MFKTKEEREKSERFCVGVVEHNNLPMFKLSQFLLIDSLDAHYLDGSDVEVLRDGKLLASGYVTGHGGMDYTSYFSIPGIRADHCPAHGDLLPTDFLVGDEIIFYLQAVTTADILFNLIERYKRIESNKLLYKEQPGVTGESSDEVWDAFNRRFHEIYDAMEIPHEVIIEIRLRDIS